MTPHRRIAGARGTRRRLGLALVLLAGMGLGGELCVRAYLALPPPVSATHVADPDAGYRIRPGYGDHPEDHPDHINAFGFRDREHAIEKAPRTIRVAGIGDSFVYGVVPPGESFLRVAGARLERHVADSLDVEMIMMGLGGYSPENYTGLLRSLALGLDPDAVVLCFFAGNDVTGIPIRAEVLRGRRYFTGARDPWHRMLRRSRLFLLTEHALVRMKRRAERTVTEPAGAGETPTRPPLGERFLEIQRARLPVYLRVPGAGTEKLWREAEAQLRAFDRLCDDAGVPWLLLAIPAEVQVDPDVRAQVLAHAGVSEKDVSADAPQKRLADIARALDVTLVDPLAELRRRHRADSLLYFPNDTHWNTRGNRVAGEILGDALGELLQRSSR